HSTSESMSSTLQNAALMQANTIAKLEKIISEQKEMIATREQRIQLLLRQKYCSSSEKLKLAENGQLNLFDEISAPTPEEPAPETTLVPAHERKKKGGGRRALPEDLMRIRREYLLEGAELDCTACGEQMAEIGEETSEQLEIIPAVTYVVEHAVKKYACKHCEECVKQADKPPQPIPKSMAGPGLLSHIIVSKFCDSLPLYRQESILRRSGVELDRSRLCQWLKHCAKLLSPLVLLMRDKILAYDVSFADETIVQVLKEVGRKAQKKSYMWVFSGGQPDQFSIVYRYYPGRHGVVATDFFEGYEGYLHADGYVGYNPVCSKGTKRIGCWGHGRRKFVDVLKGLSA
ncbi:MAG: IS66 family transposase, partial [Gammaproteobacteria bacterium]|nr:IS66 family transposase [Gammaproteobacteria bacterium]